MSDILRPRHETPIHAGRIDTMTWTPETAGAAGAFVLSEIDVSWFRRCTYDVVLTHERRLVKTVASFTDVGALFTGCDDAIARGRSAARDYAVTAGSSLNVEVVLSVRDEPNVARPTPAGSGFSHWGNVPEGVYRRDMARAAQWLALSPEARSDRGGLAALGPLAPIVLVDRLCIWSSHEESVEARAKLFDDIRGVPLRIPQLAPLELGVSPPPPAIQSLPMRSSLWPVAVFVIAILWFGMLEDVTKGLLSAYGSP